MKRPKPRYIYLAHEVGTSRYKVGVSADLKDRAYRLSHPGRDVVMIHSVYTAEPFRTEALVHGLLCDFALGGEWFDLTPEMAERAHVLINEASTPVPHRSQPMATEPQKLLTPEEVADRLGWHIKSVYRACKEGRILSQKIGGRVFVPESAVTIDVSAERASVEVSA